MNYRPPASSPPRPAMGRPAMHPGAQQNVQRGTGGMHQPQAARPASTLPQQGQTQRPSPQMPMQQYAPASYAQILLAALQQGRR